LAHLEYGLLPEVEFFGIFPQDTIFQTEINNFGGKMRTSGEPNSLLDYPFPKEYFEVIRFHLFSIDPSS